MIVAFNSIRYELDVENHLLDVPSLNIVEVRLQMWNLIVIYVVRERDRRSFGRSCSVVPLAL
jgi:hypothetical protein